MYPAKPGLIIGFHGCDLSERNMNLPGPVRKLSPKVIDKLLKKGRAEVRIYFGEGRW